MPPQPASTAKSAATLTIRFAAQMVFTMQKYLFPAVLVAAAIGWLLATVDSSLSLGGGMALLQTLFLSALKMIVAPLIFFSLLAGILRLRAAADFGKLSAVTLSYYFCTTAIAIALGLTAVYWIHPWTAFPPPANLADVTASFGADDVAFTQALSLVDLIAALLARMFVNPFAALAELNILGIVTGAVLLGLALLVALPKDSRLPALVNDVTAVFYRLAAWVVWLVPLGVVAVVYRLTIQADAQLLQGLLAFALLVVAVTLVHGIMVLPAIAWLVGACHPLRFARHAGSAFVVALSSSSSAATLPVSLRAARSLRVSDTNASFVLPLGATINMDGTALFEGIAAVFLAYLFGVELGPLAVATVFFVAMMSSIGAPGIPSGSMAAMQMVLLAVGIPLEGIAILLLVERPLDAIRTAVNVEGDLTGALVAQRFAGRAGAAAVESTRRVATQ